MQTCLTCHTENPPDAHFCISCGTELPLHVCPACGAEVPPGASFCPGCGAQVGTAATTAAETLKLATVLFADVVASTARAEALHPEDTRDLMLSYFGAMSEEIRAEGGTIEKFIGDAVMAIFGVPVSHEDDPVRAVRAARRMNRRLERWNEGRAEADRLAIRIGINTGDVLAAAEAGPDLLVTGDPVNVAARLEQAAAPGQILIGDRTFRSVRNHFDLEPAGELELKGKSAPIEAWLVTDERGVIVERGIPGLHAPLIGRDHEVAVLRTVFERVRTDGRPQLVTVVGDPGVGKSRLVREVVSSVEADAVTLSGRCLPYGEGVTLWPLMEILKTESGILNTDPQELALEKLEKTLNRTVPSDMLGGDHTILAPLASTIGMQLDDDPLAGADPRQVFRELLRSWRIWLSALSIERPVVVVIEDIHWADKTMLEVLEDLSERVEGPVLFLCPTRPDLFRSRPDWGGGRRNYTSLPLEPLTRAQSEDLVTHLLAVADIPIELTQAMLQRSEGNPFFLEEIIRRLIDEGRLVHDQDHWRAVGDISDVQIPDNIQAVVLARLDLLDPRERRVIQQASVVGRVFWTGAVEALTAAGDIEDILGTLRRRELVLERLSSSMAGEQEYIFKHILIRDVAYESLPRRDRGKAHATVGEWIESRSGNRVDEFSELLAFHWETAYSLLDRDDLRDKARARYMTASARAQRRFALELAQTYGQKAVDLSHERADRIEALEVLGNILVQTFQGDAAFDAYAKAISELRATSDPDRETLARLCGKAAVIPARWVGSMQERPAREMVDELLEVGLAAAGEDSSRSKARLLLSKAMHNSTSSASSYTGNDEAFTLAQEAVAMAEEIDDPDMLSSALDALGARNFDEGLWRDEEELYAQRVALVPRLSDVIEIGDTFAVGAWAALYLGHYPEAVHRATLCVDASRGVEAGAYLHGLAWRVFARVMSGEWDAALEDFAEVERLANEDPRDLPVPYSFRAYGAAAWCHELRGHRDAVDRYLELDRRFRAVHPNLSMGGGSHFVARILVRHGRAHEARSLIDLEALPVRCLQLEALTDIAAGQEDWDACDEIRDLVEAEVERAGSEALPYFLSRLLGLSAIANGDAEGAAASLRDSVDGFVALGAPWEEAWSRLLLGETMMSIGEAGADGEIRRALDTFQRLGSVREIERAQAALGQPST